ncbi:hypothetical protein LAZ67_10001459 [Cordylochernes scorpioides]|uniref:RNA-directed DNA polymerase n=1 Tax=Cordylochernes scorpioides TaxID=51811 RepID=A0ABY6KZ83_9ARAC|nr:hypothetical protein LAZ67_10001459 [Cordylochernes scorpioides]
MPGHRKRRQFKQTDAFTRGMVIGLKREGWSIRQIAADTHLGASTVHRLWRIWLEQGNVAIYRNVGTTRVTSARVDRRILQQAVAAPQATCTAILQHVQDTLDHSISTRTISRRLVANGLHSCRPLRRLPLTPPNRRQRLEWCRARSTDSRRVRVWRRRGERSNPAEIVERPTVRQRGIMVWGAIAYDSRSPLLRIQGTMTAQRYVDDVLRPVTLPYLQGVPNALYQQDNARPHTARISQQALQDVQMLPWPPYSPDLSPIEHVWDIIGRRLHALPQPRSEDELWPMVEREWRAIPQDAIRTLIDSLPRRVAACIAVRGVTRRSRRLQGLQPELSTVLALTARKKMEREENRPFCHRWRYPTVFSGERGKDSQRCLSDFQRVARYNKWDDSMCLANVIFYLTGTEKCWFKNFEEILNSWKEFKIKFCEIFGNKEDTAWKAENILRTRAQTSGENVESYIQEVPFFVNRATPEYRKEKRFNRLPNVTTISTAEPENLEALIRRIEREEVQKFMAPPSTFAAQYIDTPPPDLRDVIRSEIQQTLAPISAPHDRPICFHCWRPGHVARYCRDRRQAFADARNGRETVDFGNQERKITPWANQETNYPKEDLETRRHIPTAEDSKPPEEPHNPLLAVPAAHPVAASHRCHYRLWENKFYLSEAEKSYEWKDLKLCAAMDCVLPPKSFGKIVVTNQDVFGSRDVVITGSKRLQLEKGFFIPSSLVRFLHGRAVLWVTNSTHQSQVIPSDMKCPYRVSPAERRVIQSEVEKMMEIKIIRPSSSPWASSIILVRKKDGSLRFCVDYRRLNKITKKDVYPLPRIDDALDTLSGSRYFSTMDMRSGYWQIEVDDMDREKTTFITPDGLYEFNVMPIGLCNAPATFERMIDNVLRGLKWDMCLCYLDDIVVYGSTFKEHLTRLYKPDPEKVKAIVHFPKPRNISETRSFLGLSSYYRRFIKSYANKSRPLKSLLTKGEKFIWGEEQDESFRILKQKLGSSPVLGHFVEGAETHVHTDASGYGLGAVLVQIQNDEERPIAYASRTLTKAENNYSTTEKECLAVVWALGKFRPYLYGRPFTVVTDHHMLCWLVGMKDPSGRLARWALKLQEYDINIVYKSGRKHKDADCLSRSPLADTAEIEGHVISIQDAAEEQSKDPRLVGIREKLANENLKGYQMIGSVLYKKIYDPEGKSWLLVVPKQMRHEILKDVHDTPMAGHLGFAKTYDRVINRFYWPGLYRTVSQYIAHCKECQRRKGVPQKPPGLLVPIPPTTSPFQKIGIDYLGRFPIYHTGNSWIIVATDYLTRFAITKATTTAEVTELATFLIEDVILTHGAPREIITD